MSIFLFSFLILITKDGPLTAPTTAPSRQPSQFPTVVPTFSPTAIPTNAPSLSPTSSPTNTYCDSGVQTSETFKVCTFFETLESWPNDLDLHESNYCNIHVPQYFQCDSSNINITKILVNNFQLFGEITSEMIDYLPQSIQILDLSHNSLTGTIDFWNQIYRFEKLDLSYNGFSGIVDFSEIGTSAKRIRRILRRGLLSNTTAATTTDVFDPDSDSVLTELYLNDNDWDEQALTWDHFQYLPNLKRLDLSNNQFAGTIDFSQLKNLKYFNLANNSFTHIYGFEELNGLVQELNEFYINDNNILEEFELSWLPNNLTILKCTGNRLFGDLSMNSIPQTLLLLECGNNDFGTLEWSVADEYSTSTYELQYLSMCFVLISCFVFVFYFYFSLFFQMSPFLPV